MFAYYVCVCCVYLLCINTHMYIYKKIFVCILCKHLYTIYIIYKYLNIIIYIKL